MEGRACRPEVTLMVMPFYGPKLLAHIALSSAQMFTEDFFALLDSRPRQKQEPKAPAPAVEDVFAVRVK